MLKRSEYRVRVKERYQQLNIWNDFVSLRDKYSRMGLTPADSFAAAMGEIEELYPEGKPQSIRGGAVPRKLVKLRPIMEDLQHDEHVRRLVKASAGRDSPPVKVFTWVFNHVGVPFTDIAPDDIPSPGAVYLLGKVKKDDKAYQKFLTDFAKLLPPRSQLEEVENRRSDDGRKQFQLLDQLEAEFYKTKE